MGEDPGASGVCAAELVAHSGKDVRITSSIPGVVVLDGMVHLELDPAYEFYVARVRVEGRELGAAATLRAQVGEEYATCRVTVSKASDEPRLLIKIEDEDAGNLRARVDLTEDGCTVRIMGRHPVTRRYLGAPPESHQSPTTPEMSDEALRENRLRYGGLLVGAAGFEPTTFSSQS